MEPKKGPPDYTVIYIKDGKICSQVIKGAMNNEPLLEFIDNNSIPQSAAFFTIGATHLFPMSYLWRDSDGNYDPDDPTLGPAQLFPNTPAKRHQDHERVTDARDIGLF